MLNEPKRYVLRLRGVGRGRSQLLWSQRGFVFSSTDGGVMSRGESYSSQLDDVLEWLLDIDDVNWASLAGLNSAQELGLNNHLSKANGK